MNDLRMLRLRYGLVTAALLSLALMPTTRAWATPDIDVAGFAQPEGAWKQEDKSKPVTGPQRSGFSVRRVRAITRAMFDVGQWKAFGMVEAEFAPQFQLLDAFVALARVLPGRGALTIVGGQGLTFFSRQVFTPSWKLQFVKLPEMVSLMPNRQIGLAFLLAVPYADWLELGFGAYNGEGPNNVQNIDSKLMYIGRANFRFFREHVAWVGPLGTPTEGGLARNELSMAFNISYNDRDLTDFHELSLAMSGELFAVWKGFSAGAEYFWQKTYYSAGAPKTSFLSQGFYGNVGYLLPLPGWWRDRFELAFRFEAISPNNKLPIQTAGDPTQARASYIAGLNYYHRGHGIKLMANYSHNQELDSKDRLGNNISYKNDTFIVQLTYRLE